MACGAKVKCLFDVRKNFACFFEDFLGTRKNPIVYVPLTVVCVPDSNVYPLGRMGLALERIFLRRRT
jgi:hypothetical protein